MTIVDLSHPVTCEQPCTFSTSDLRPLVSYEEGEAHGTFFAASRIDNLHSNMCTHVDFPGHLPCINMSYRTVGSYPLDRFIGPTAVLDFSHKLTPLADFFNKDGRSTLDVRSEQQVLRFLETLDLLAIASEEIDAALLRCGTSLDSVIGIIIYSGLSEFWEYGSFESWEKMYFFNPFFSVDSCRLLIDHKLSFVGIDSLQIEHPIINFRGDELPLVLHTSCREYVKNKLAALDLFANHRYLLGNDILIYEHLRIPSSALNGRHTFAGPPLNLQMSGLVDNALVRPYLIMQSCLEE